MLVLILATYVRVLENLRAITTPAFPPWPVITLFPNAEFKKPPWCPGYPWMPLRHPYYGCYLRPLLLYASTNAASCVALQMIASGIWRRCNLWLLYVFTWHWCKTSHGTAVPCHTDSLSQGKCITSLKMFGPSSWDLFYFAGFCIHLQTLEVLRGLLGVLL